MKVNHQMAKKKTAKKKKDPAPQFLAEHGTVKQKEVVVDPARVVLQGGPRYGDTFLFRQHTKVEYLVREGNVLPTKLLNQHRHFRGLPVPAGRVGALAELIADRSSDRRTSAGRTATSIVSR